MEASESRWTVESMQRRLAKDPVAVERALITLFYQQTQMEVNTESTREDNGVGFNATDAQILTSFTSQILHNRGGYPDGRRLSPKQMAIATRKIRKYAAQLLRLAGLPVRREKAA